MRSSGYVAKDSRYRAFGGGSTHRSEHFQCHMPGKQRLENQKQCLPELDIDLCFLFASWLQIITCVRNPTESTDISKYLAVTLISKKFLSRYSDHGHAVRNTSLYCLSY